MANEDSELRRDDGEMDRKEEPSTADVEGHRKSSAPGEERARRDDDEPDVEAHRAAMDPKERGSI